jgi:hypothetical protein
MLAAAVADPRAVILRWLRLAGIIALCMAGLAAFFAGRSVNVSLIATILAILGQLAFVQVAWRRTQRALATIAFGCAIAVATLSLQRINPTAGIALLAVVCALTAGVVGVALMDMLLGHAYLNAADMTIAPFIRLNRVLAALLVMRGIVSVGGTFLMQSRHPIEMFWNLYGLYVGTRWLVGFGVAGMFVYMAHDCIKRRSTQSATGILYVADVLLFVAEIIGLYVMSETGFPV